jgi:CheY-like chemotaxis protein
MRARRVLIVDDEESLRHTVHEALRLSGYEVSEAPDGPDGLDQADRLRPDVILLDIHMPGIDGYTVCRSLKENPATKPIPVVFLTGVTDTSMNRLAYAAGGVACLTKPFRLEALVGVMEAAMATGKRAEAERLASVT